MERIVVVGGGMAGLQTLTELRERGFGGRLTLLAEERHPPYDRPPLSKEVLLGRLEDTRFPVDWPTLNVDVRFGCPALGLEDGAVRTEDGAVAYDGLVLATGAAPVRLPRTEELPSVHVLRTLDDALALHAALAPDARVVVIGAGWIGAEVATAAAASGCRVSVVEALGSPLPGVLPAEVGAHMAAWYDEAGVDLRLDTRVDSVQADRVLLADGEQLAADVVVVGIGVRPATGWLRGSGVELSARGAVVVDACLRTSLPDAYAVGDCAAYPSRRSGTLLHVEHWTNARQAPRTAAANLLGGQERYDPVPYFWSHQFGRMVQYVGHHGGDDVYCWRGEPSQRAWSVCWLRDRRLVALLAVRRPRDLAHATMLIEEQRPVDTAKLTDPAVPIAEAATG